MIRCEPEEFLSLAFDIERYYKFDDRTASVQWVRAVGPGVVQAKVRPCLPGTTRWEPCATLDMKRTSSQITVRLASWPKSWFQHGFGKYFGTFTATEDEQGCVVTRTVEHRMFPIVGLLAGCLLYTSPSPRDKRQSRMPSSA